MFEPIKQIAKNVKKINASKLFNEFVLKDSLLVEQILDLIREEQLYNKGIDGAGKLLGTYTLFTLNYKNNLASQLGNDTRSDHITLKNTGKVYNSMRIIPQKDYFLTVANVLKENGISLTEQYGDDILDFTDESKSEIGKIILQVFSEEIPKAITKGL